MGRSATKLASIAVLLLVAAGACSADDGASGTRTLAFGEHLEVRIVFDEGTSIDITYEVTVTEGPPVNVYFLDADGHDAYEDPTATGFPYFIKWSNVGTTHASEGFSIDTRGTYYVVVENTAASLENATVEYLVGHAPTPWTRQAAFWAVGAAVLVGVPATMVLLRRRWARGPPEGPASRPQAPPPPVG